MEKTVNNRNYKRNGKTPMTPKSMTLSDEEILKRAIEKAIKNGWVNPHVASDYYGIILSHDFAKAFWGEKQVCKDCKSNNLFMESCECLGEEFCGHSDFPTQCKDCGREDENNKQFIQTWQYNLREMVLEENPLLYISKFL